MSLESPNNSDHLLTPSRLRTSHARTHGRWEFGPTIVANDCHNVKIVVVSLRVTLSQVKAYCRQEESMANRVITRERGVIRGCIPAGPDSHVAVDGLGRPWIQVAKLPSTIDAWLAALREETRQSRIRRGRNPKTGELIETAPTLRSDLTAEERVTATRVGRIGFASAGARRKAA
jgi:hypothetical protein